MLKDNYITHLKDIQQLSDEYAEKIISKIYESIRLADWDTAEEDILNIYWEGYEKNYALTKKWLMDNYAVEASLEPFISDFKTLSYHRDGIDIEERMKRKLQDYQDNSLSPNIKIKVAYEIQRQTNTEYKYFFYNLTKQTLVENFPSSQIYITIDNLNGYDDCSESIICEEYHDKFQNGLCITNIQDTDLPPYHPDCECFPIFEIRKIEN